MDLTPLFRRYPELKEFFIMLQQQMQSLQRPANEIILSDQDVMKMLQISERKLDGMKAKRIIPFSQPIQRSSCYWLLSDILEWLKKSRKESLDNDCRI
jgi:predicted DNA-binding transcriptional regulator AlpA